MNSSKTYFISDSRESRKHLWRNNLILFFALMILIFVAPLMDHLGRIVTSTALVLVVIAGIFAAEYRKHVFNLLLSLGFLVLFSMALSILFPEQRLLLIITFMLIVLSLTLSTIALIFHMSMASSVEKSTILCAINSYLLMGLTASTIFIILDLFVPNSFINLETGPGNLSSYIYFGFVTLTTLGYGDISPSAPLARSLSIFVAVAGQLYLVIIMALIIGKFLNSRKQDS
jgi:Ion channel